MCKSRERDIIFTIQNSVHILNTETPGMFEEEFFVSVMLSQSNARRENFVHSISILSSNVAMNML